MVQIVPDPEEQPAAEPSNVTVFDDSEHDADGYAFMRDARSRRTGVESAVPGSTNSLRAKLREAEEQAQARSKAAQTGGTGKPHRQSMTARLLERLGKLFS